MKGDNTQTPAESNEHVYDQLLEKRKHLAYLEGIEGILTWDQLTTLPEGGTPARSKQQGALSSVIQQRRTDTTLGDLLETVDQTELTAQQRANVREIHREYERNVSVPPELAEELSETTATATEAWQRAKADDDFVQFEDHLQQIVELKQEEAAEIDPDSDPYEVLFKKYAPYTDLETLERIFDRLRRELVPLVEAIRESDAELRTDVFEDTFEIDTQVAFCRDILDDLGYDWDRGHAESVPNGITVGDQFDSRIGLWPFEDDLFITLFAAIHEFGHALYYQNLPTEHYGTPLGADRGTYVQESQSTFWDFHVGRTQAFWEYLRPSLTERFPSIDASARELYESFVQVRPEEPNVLRADELTLHLHMLVRFEVERALIAGDITPSDVPEVWRDAYEEYLGFEPDSDAEGPLLTIHWAEGSIGYFPTYTLGPVLAAQFAAAAREEIDNFDGTIRRGEFGPLREWLREEIHRHGQRYTTPELIQRVTGEELTVDYFLGHVTEKYTELYDM